LCCPKAKPWSPFCQSPELQTQQTIFKVQNLLWWWLMAKADSVAISDSTGLLIWTLLPQQLVTAIGFNENSTETHYDIQVLTKFQSIFSKNDFDLVSILYISRKK
jgi:hypothetical protein